MGIAFAWCCPWLRAVTVTFAGVAWGFGPCRKGGRSSAVPVVLSHAGLRQGITAQGTAFAAPAPPFQLHPQGMFEGEVPFGWLYFCRGKPQ